MLTRSLSCLLVFTSLAAHAAPVESPSTRWLEVTVTERRPDRPQTAAFFLVALSTDGGLSKVVTRMGSYNYQVTGRLDTRSADTLEMSVARAPTLRTESDGGDLDVVVRCALERGKPTVVAKRHHSDGLATHVSVTLR